MIFHLIFLISISQKKIDEQPIIIDGARSLFTSEYIFISTPFGLYTFDRSVETWSRVTQATGLPDNNIEIVGLDEGIIWVSTQRGLASADVRLNDWRTYDLPGKIKGIDFDNDYVWIGSDVGLIRFDKFLEGWEDVSDLAITDILSEKNYVWLATGDGILRYNRDFENIEQVPNAPDYPYYHIIITQGMIWFLADNQFVVYKKSNESWAEHGALEISDYANIGDSLFVVSKGNVHYYNPTTDNWHEFVEVGGLEKVNGISVNSSNILFATDQGLIIYNWQDKTRKLYNRTTGMTTDSLIDAYETPNAIFVVSQYDIQFLNKETKIWQTEELKPTAERRRKIFYIDEAGLHAGLIEDFDIRLQGRAYYSETRSTPDLGSPVSEYENINLRLIGQSNAGRLISLYYDDTDEEQVMYGFGYRGLEKDPIYRLNGGYLKSEYYRLDLIPQHSTFGANAKIRYANHNMDMQAGKLQSNLRNDFYYGRSYKIDTLIFDIDYSENTFYSIHSAPQQIDKVFDTIFVDDGLLATNTPETRLGFTIGNITGDFDPLINGIDYFIDYSKGIVHFLTPRRASDIIVMLLNGFEIVIQSETITDHVLLNIYFLGPDIIPNSLILTIVDTLGQSQPLSSFGLDNNDDNHIDPEFINYDLGYLIFPQPRPFPDQVYDDTLHIFTIDFEFLTYSIFYRLSYHPVVIGSEKVLVDGDIMDRGTHYIVDYTSGILIFLRDDIVSDFSEIEVQYSSVQREREDFFYSLEPNVAIGDAINIAPGFSSIANEKMFHITGNLETGRGGNKSVRFIPQFIINAEKDYAQDYSLVANYGIFGLNANYRGYSERFESFGMNEKKYGRLENHGILALSVEPIPYIRLDGRFKKEYQIDSLYVRHVAQYTFGRINYLNPKLPNVSLLFGKNYLPDYEKDRIHLNTNYDVAIKKFNIKFNTALRNDLLKSDGNNKNILEYIINANVSFPFPVRADLYLRSINVYDNGEKEKDESEIRLTLNMDVVPGLYYTGNYNLKVITYPLDSLKNLSLRNYFYNNINIAPGRWYSKLSVVNFSLGTGNNFDEYIGNLRIDYQNPLFIFNPLESPHISSINTSNNYFVTVQFNPYASLVIWAKHSLTKSGIAYYAMPDLQPTNIDEIRIEYEPRNFGFFNVTWDRRKTWGYPEQIIENFYLEWNKSWTAFLRTKIYSNLRMDRKYYNITRTENSEAKINSETLLRFWQKSYINLILGTVRKYSNTFGTTYSIVPGTGLNVNLFKFLYLQLDYESDIVLNGGSSHSISTKITGSF